MKGEIFLERTKEPSKQALLEEKLKILASEEKWDEVTEVHDHLDINNNRKHKEWRDNMDITVVDRGLQEDGAFQQQSS